MKQLVKSLESPFVYVRQDISRKKMLHLANEVLETMAKANYVYYDRTIKVGASDSNAASAPRGGGTCGHLQRLHYGPLRAGKSHVPRNIRRGNKREQIRARAARLLRAFAFDRGC